MRPLLLSGYLIFKIEGRKKMSNELEARKKYEVTEDLNDMPLGFEDADIEDIVIPRIKVINALSPERQDGVADEGAILNSLTKDVILPEHRFVPLKVTYTNIDWVPRDEGEGIQCRSLNGKIGQNNTTGETLVCSRCRRNEFDNTKQGKAAQPKCTKYINFLGFFEHDMMPVVLSFSRTNYNEGKKLLSIAKSLRDNMFNHAYSIVGKLQTKDKNRWYNIATNLVGDTSEDIRIFAKDIYHSLAEQELKLDLENTNYSSQTDTDTDNINVDDKNIGF